VVGQAEEAVVEAVDLADSVVEVLEEVGQVAAGN
jgi:hypothetical protein